MISKHAFFSFSPHTYISINNSYDPDDIRKLSVNSITLRYSSVTCFLCSALILMLIHVDGCSCLSFIFTLCSFTLYEYVIIYPISCWKTCELFLSFLQLHTALNPNVLVCVSSYPGVGDALFRTGLFWVTGCKHLDITRLLTAGASPHPSAQHAHILSYTLQSSQFLGSAHLRNKNRHLSFTCLALHIPDYQWV